MSDQAIEQEIQAKGLIAPRVTPAGIEACIGGEFYFTAEDGIVGASQSPDSLAFSEVVHSGQKHSLALLTFCVLVLRNGFTITGESACASPENFDAEVGRKRARQNAVNKIWPLEGYLLKQRLADTPPPQDNAHVAPGCEQFPEPILAIEQRVRRIVAEQMGVDEDGIKTEASFVNDLGGDSLDEVEMVMAFEDEFGIQISDEDAGRIKTVQQAIDYITSKVQP